MELDDLLDGNSEDGWKWMEYGWNFFKRFWYGMPDYPLLDWFCMKDGNWKWMECMRSLQNRMNVETVL